ncbi:MAG: hypothetical protein J6T97_05300 [Bacteroidaceae bacterium]|nr:hypothetical protein [Bacteroidaceae bacterium]
MLTLLLSAIFATTPNIGEISAQADTINQYTIDGKAVSNFDGSQLVGLSIADYNISVSKEKGKVVRKHTITTSKAHKTTSSSITTNSVSISVDSNSDDKVSISGISPDEMDKVLWIVNDEKVEKEKVNGIKQSNVKSISVLKGKAAETVFGEEGAGGVVIIQVK